MIDNICCWSQSDALLLCRQGAILTTMLATRNFSSKYEAQGEYLRPSSALHMEPWQNI